MYPKLSAPAASAKTESNAEVRGAVDLPFLILTLLLVAIGLVMLFSASFASSYSESGNAAFYFIKQLIFAAAGLAIMYVASLINYQSLRALAFPSLALSVFLLVLVLLIGSKVNGARRWINLGFTTFQPSELAKLSVVLTFSAMISMKKDEMKTVRHGILPYAAVLGLVAVLLILEPHLSATIIILCVGAVMMFLGGVRLRWFIGGGAILLIGGYLLINTMGYASERLATWRDPFSDPSDAGYQIIQSLYAIGSGGLFGLGLGKSRQKYLYLPEEHNDFIFAIVCEELGMVGAVVVILLFALLIIRGYWLAMHARDRFGSLLIAGFTTLLALQVFLNIAVVTNLIPTTGISLPFFSAGGTSLMVQLYEMGIVLNVSRYNIAKKPG